METQNRLPAAIGGMGGGYWWKEGEGTSQRTCMNDPWTWTIVWGLTAGVGLGWAEEGKSGKIGTTVIE